MLFGIDFAALRSLKGEQIPSCETLYRTEHVERSGARIRPDSREFRRDRVLPGPADNVTHHQQKMVAKTSCLSC